MFHVPWDKTVEIRPRLQAMFNSQAGVTPSPLHNTFTKDLSQVSLKPAYVVKDDLKRLILLSASLKFEIAGVRHTPDLRRAGFRLCACWTSTLPSI